MHQLLVGLALYGLFPLWVVAGFADYCCHRITNIERTTGRAESLLHAVQYVQIVAGIALSLFFEPTSLVLVLVIALAVLHLSTGYVDIAYTTDRRRISPSEQHVHSYMEVLPLVATALLVILNWSPFARFSTVTPPVGSSWADKRHCPRLWSRLSAPARHWPASPLLKNMFVAFGGDGGTVIVDRSIGSETSR